MGKYQTVKQNLSNVNVNRMFEANTKVTIEQVVQKYKDDLNKRSDLPKSVKNALLTKPVGRDYEVVYYPTYIYRTNTDVSWNTTRKDEGGVYADGHRVGTLKTTSTVSHTKTGIKGVSSLKVKDQHEELDIEKVDLQETGLISNFRSLTISVYQKNLFFTKEENNSNAISAGRDAAKAKSGHSTYTSWQADIVLVPILRYTFEHEGKPYIFEMNLHNGEYCTAYTQKPMNEFFRKISAVMYQLLFLVGVILPIASAVDGFMNKHMAEGFLKFLLCLVGIIVAEIMSIIFWVAFHRRRRFTFERATRSLNPLSILRPFVAPIVTVAIIATITTICCNAMFVI